MKNNNSNAAIQQQIDALNKELTELERIHALFAATAKKTIVANKTRFIQITAKLEALRALLPTNPTTEDKKTP